MNQPTSAVRKPRQDEYFPLRRMLHRQARTLARRISKQGDSGKSRDDIVALLSLLKQSISLR